MLTILAVLGIPVMLAIFAVLTVYAVYVACTWRVRGVYVHVSYLPHLPYLPYACVLGLGDLSLETSLIWQGASCRWETSLSRLP